MAGCLTESIPEYRDKARVDVQHSTMATVAAFKTCGHQLKP